MAQDATLEGIRSSVMDSIKGRKLGIDPTGLLVGQAGVRAPITALTSLSSGATLAAYGLSTIFSASAGIPFLLAAPIPGVEKELLSISSGGGVVTLASGNFQTTAGSTTTSVTFSGANGGYVRLMGISTAVYFVTDNKAASSAAGTPLATFV